MLFKREHKFLTRNKKIGTVIATKANHIKRSDINTVSQSVMKTNRSTMSKSIWRSTSRVNACISIWHNEIGCTKQVIVSCFTCSLDQLMTVRHCRCCMDHVIACTQTEHWSPVAGRWIICNSRTLSGPRGAGVPRALCV